MNGPHETCRFGEFLLDLDRGALLRNDEEVALRPKSFEVLCHLVRNQGRLVSKEELLDSIWAGTAVTEGALTQCIIDVRRALGDDGHRMVRTVPRRGFIFEPEVSTSAAASLDGAAAPAGIAQPARQWPVLVAGLVVAALAGWWAWTAREAPPVMPAAPSADTALPANAIAVLPFEDLSPGGDHQYLSDGLAEEILNLLTRVPELRVVARTSSFSFRDRALDAPAIARQLNARYLLEGSVRTDQQQVRVTAQLIDAASGMHLWSETFDRELKDLFELQDDIAAQITDKLHLRIARPRTLGAGARDSRAQVHYLQGHYFYDRRDPGDVQRALTHFEEAVRIDPTHARAWAGISATCNLLVFAGADEQLFIERMGEAADRALALEPALPEAHVRKARHLWLVGAEAESDAHMRQALELGPNDPLVLSVFAGHLMFSRDFDAAIALMRRALESDPLHPVNNFNFAHLLLYAGRLDEAQAALRRIAELRGPQESSSSRGLVELARGRAAAALAQFERSPAGAGRDAAVAMALHSLGRRAESDLLLRGLLPTCDPAANLVDCDKAIEVLAWRGEADRAFTLLGQIGTAGNSPWRRVLLREIYKTVQVSPFAAALRDDSRWADWLARQEFG